MSYGKLSSVIFLVLILIAVHVHGGADNKIIGKWTIENSDASYEYFADGATVWNTGKAKIKGTYKFLDDGSLMVELSVFGIKTGEVYKVSFNGNTMSLTDSKDRVKKYIRAKQLKSK